MVQRAKLELPINQPVEVELLYDEPVTGENQFGNYYLYAVKSNGTEYAFFAPESVHQELISLRRGDRATITKLAAKRGSKSVTKYAVEVLNSVHVNELPDETADSSKTSEITPNNRILPGDESIKSIGNHLEDHSNTDEYFKIMLDSYKDALNIQAELNGMVDVSRVAITLFIARSKNGNFTRL